MISGELRGDQQKRNRLAGILLVVLLPVLIYLAMSTADKVRGVRRAAPAPAAGRPAAAEAAPAAQALVMESLALLDERKESALDSRILTEQKRLAGQAPERDPFASGQASRTGPVSTAGKPSAMRLTGFMNHAQPARRRAIIDNQIVKEGDTINGWKVLKITSESVLVGSGTNTYTITSRAAGTPEGASE